MTAINPGSSVALNPRQYLDMEVTQTIPNSQTFVFKISLFLLAIIGTVFLYRLPRAIALFGSSEWTSGHILRRVSRRLTPITPIPRSISRSGSKSASRSNSKRAGPSYDHHRQPTSPTSPSEGHHDGAVAATDDSHTLAYHTSHPHTYYTHATTTTAVAGAVPFKRLDSKGREIEMQYPTHLASCPWFLRWAMPTLHYRITPMYSVAQAIVFVGYLWILIFATVFRSNFFVDYNRVGWLATAQVPFVMAYGVKNGVLGWMWGVGYEKLNYIHRFAGRMVVIGANLHGIGFAYKWSLEGTFTQSIKASDNTWGVVALVAIDVLWLFSLAYVRQHFYNIFLISHLVCFSLAMPALYFHRPTLIPYVLACLGIFGLDYVLRILKTRTVTGTIRPLPELDLTRIEIPNINAGWRAGQHVRVRILSSGLGWFGWTEVHPFTIASVGAISGMHIGSGGAKRRRRGTVGGGGMGEEEGMVLMCKRTGRWTKNLYEMAKMSAYVDGCMGREVKLWIEGPYGGPGHTNFSSFSAAVVVVGGSGISFGLSAVKDLVQKDLKGMSRVKSVDLIWVVQDPSSLTPLLPTLTALIHSSVFTPLRIAVHYTRAPSPGTQPPIIPAIPGLSITPGRPKIARAIDGAISRALSVGVIWDRHDDPGAAGAPSMSRSRSKRGGAQDYREKDLGRSDTLRSGAPGAKGKEGEGTMSVGPREKEDIQEITGVIVGVCGPHELARDVASAVGSVDGSRMNRVGGVEIHEETFGW